MKICCISDTHGRHFDVEFTDEQYNADVLVYAGDWTMGNDINLLEADEFLSWMHRLPFKHKILVAGNHEVTVEEAPERFVHMLSFYPSITYLMNKEVVIDGVKFFGSPYSNEFFDWAFMEDEWDLAEIWRMIPDDVNVLITHGPAYGCNDRVINSGKRDPHVGSAALTKRKQELKGTLKAHISGHIHEAYGAYIDEDGVTNICACLLDEKYRFVNAPILLEL